VNSDLLCALKKSTWLLQLWQMFSEKMARGISYMSPLFSVMVHWKDIDLCEDLERDHKNDVIFLYNFPIKGEMQISSITC
jgi:hypothetical protein